MNSRNPKVDKFIGNAKKWQEEYQLLRGIALDCELTEELKWGKPAYTYQGKNIVLIHGFKDYCALLFMKGALLSDAQSILIQQTENVQAARQIRFTSVQEITAREALLKDYISEAIEVEKSGLKVDFKESKNLVYPDEFQIILDNNPELKTAFEALTPGRQRAYNIYFSSPKQSKTRVSRVEKYIQHILNGKGLNDQ